MKADERERLRLTITGLVNNTLDKYPNADAQSLKQLWSEAVDAALKARKGKRKGAKGKRKPPGKRPE